jgi:hypothetical protein
MGRNKDTQEKMILIVKSKITIGDSIRSDIFGLSKKLTKMKI